MQGGKLLTVKFTTATKVYPIILIISTLYTKFRNFNFMYIIYNFIFGIFLQSSEVK